MSTVDEEVDDDSCARQEAMKNRNINEYFILGVSSGMTFIDLMFD